MKKIFSFLCCMIPTLALAEGGAPAAAGSIWQTLLMLSVAVIFFYFILWRPQQKRQKAMQEKRNAMQKGDKVTAMGILGTVDSIKDTTVILSMVDGSKIEILKMAINEVHAKS